MTSVSNISDNSEALPMIKLTEKAADFFKSSCVSGGYDLDQSLLRLSAKSGGCSGYKYELEREPMDALQVSDVEYKQHEVRVVVDQDCLVNILGALEIDYKDHSVLERGFSFRPLTQAGLCGCGESFVAVKDQK